MELGSSQEDKKRQTKGNMEQVVEMVLRSRQLTPEMSKTGAYGAIDVRNAECYRRPAIITKT